MSSLIKDLFLTYSAPDLTSTVRKLAPFSQGGNANIWRAERTVPTKHGLEATEVRLFAT